MPLQSYDQKQPDSPLDAPLWRFMPMNFFQDFMANEELYLRRCDKYIKADPQDGIPTDEYVRKKLGLRRYDINEERTLIVHQGSNRLATEMYYLSCWNLHSKAHEMQMWQQIRQRWCGHTDNVWPVAASSWQVPGQHAYGQGSLW